MNKLLLLAALVPALASGQSTNTVVMVGSLTNLNASYITTGYLPNGRLSGTGNPLASGYVFVTCPTNVDASGRAWIPQTFLRVGTAATALSGWPTSWSYMSISNAPWASTNYVAGVTTNINVITDGGTFTFAITNGLIKAITPVAP